MEKEILKNGEGDRPHEYWAFAAEAQFKFIVYRETGEILDDSECLCKKMDPPGVMKMLIGKKFKVEIWEKYLRTMKKNERARFHSSDKEDCLQYVSVSKMLRDIRDGKKAHGCMGALGGHGHAHEHKDELQELLAHPEELTFEFELLHVEKQENHQTDVWAMNKAEQRESAPKFKAEGGDFFKAGNYDKAGESYEKALKCIDLLMSTELKSDDVQKDEKEKILNNLAECLLRLERWREAENRATEVLQSSPNNEKALWRRGKARCQLLEVEGCKSDLENLVKLNPKMESSVQKELSKLDKSLKNRDKSLKNGLKNMF